MPFKMNHIQLESLLVSDSHLLKKSFIVNKLHF